MPNYISYIFFASIILYYLGILIYVTVLAMRSGKLKHFEEVNPEEIVVIFGGLDSLAKKNKFRGEV